MKSIYLKVNIAILFTALSFVIGYSRAEAATALTLKVDDATIAVTDDTVNSWRGQSSDTASPLFLGGSKQGRVSFDPAKIYTWVKTLEATTNKLPQEGSIRIENNLATEFTPPQTGVWLDTVATTRNILSAFKAGKSEAAAIKWEQPTTDHLASQNSLGIVELVGHGESNFKGSPNNRRHNIKIGMEKLKGVILAPGQQFSFDEHICPVEKATGYLPELVIKAEGTIPEYGGGLCQVSSTIFRAAMDAGLKIVQRKNHSYAVQYYAPQGTDATTYCGGVDFKFQNDMQHSVLIWPYLKDKDTLIFDLYGTKDSREVVLEKPVQYDRKSDGSMKATWIRHVTLNGVTNTDTFKSTYLPPALFHKEEKLDTPGQSTPPTNGTNSSVNPGSPTPPPAGGPPPTPAIPSI